MFVIQPDEVGKLPELLLGILLRMFCAALLGVTQDPAANIT